MCCMSQHILQCQVQRTLLACILYNTTLSLHSGCQPSPAAAAAAAGTSLERPCLVRKLKVVAAARRRRPLRPCTHPKLPPLVGPLLLHCTNHAWLLVARTAGRFHTGVDTLPCSLGGLAVCCQSLLHTTSIAIRGSTRERRKFRGSTTRPNCSCCSCRGSSCCNHRASTARP